MSNISKDWENLSVKDSIVFISRPFANRVYQIKAMERSTDDAGNQTGKLDLVGYGELDLSQFEMLLSMGVIQVQKQSWEGVSRQADGILTPEIVQEALEKAIDPNRVECTCQIFQVVNFGCICGAIEKERALKASR